jgi:hypothetical protein
VTKKGREGSNQGSVFASIGVVLCIRTLCVFLLSQLLLQSAGAESPKRPSVSDLREQLRKSFIEFRNQHLSGPKEVFGPSEGNLKAPIESSSSLPPEAKILTVSPEPLVGSNTPIGFAVDSPLSQMASMFNSIPKDSAPEVKFEAGIQLIDSADQADEVLPVTPGNLRGGTP